ncbi:hypothetical protein ACNAN0_00225 [Agrilactobacillus fermenti]|uniref:hypothetical protein n=1 Tax=Agrilactobacillus fermenti TaxID=2586909 RepID=UPI003A5C1A06
MSQVLRGEKVIEYRKKFFPDAFQAFVYTTGKNGGIEFFMKCDPPISADAQTLATIGSAIQKDDYTAIFDYFKEKNTGCLIPITAVSKIAKISLAILRAHYPKFCVPQKYLFLDVPNKQPLFEFLLDQACLANFTNDWHNYYQIIKNIIK